MREIVRIIKEICRDEQINFKSFSNDYILKLEKNNRTMYIYGNKFPNNTAAIEQICNDKAALSDILDCYNVPHVKHFYFDSPILEEYCSESGNWSKMQKLLKEYNILVCKPNKGTGGRNIFKVQTKKELEYAVLKIFQSSNSICIAPYYDIRNEYRVLVVGDEIQYVFKKIRPYIIGDGKRTIEELWKSIHDKSITITNEINWQSVPIENQKIELSWKHNLGQGAEPEIVTDQELLTALSDLAKKCVVALNLGFVSIDIIETNGKLLVLEINSGVMVEKFAKSSEANYILAKKAKLRLFKIIYI